MNILPSDTQEKLKCSLLAGESLRAAANGAGVVLNTAIRYQRLTFAALKERNETARTATPIERQVAEIVAYNRYKNGMELSTGSRWTPQEKADLRVLVSNGVEPAKAAAALGRTQSSLVHAAKGLRIKLTPVWRGQRALERFLRKQEREAQEAEYEIWRVVRKQEIAAARAERQATILAKRRERSERVDIQFPYITKPRAEHADLVAVNALMPRGLPSFVRADIVQEIMLAMLEGTVTLEQIKANKEKRRWFISRFYKQNYEQSGHAAPLSGFDDDDRSYDEIASSIAAQEWRVETMNEKRRSFDSINQMFYPPTQVEDTFDGQIRHRQFEAHCKKKFLSFEEVEAEMQNL